jgi:hypothetical protein
MAARRSCVVLVLVLAMALGGCKSADRKDWFAACERKTGDWLQDHWALRQVLVFSAVVGVVALFGFLWVLDHSLEDDEVSTKEGAAAAPSPVEQF